MKFFNYEEIYLASTGMPTLMLDYFRTNNRGGNWILNPKALIDPWVSDLHKAEYLGLCSFRSYTEYLATGSVDLKISDLPPWVPLEIVKENPLVTVTDTTIVFKKEK